MLPHLADKEYLQRFRDEAKVVVRLSHGNLVPVFDAGQVAGEIYLAMDFVEGKDLRAVWNRCAEKGIAFPVDVAVYIVKELARGLDYAHGFGDIKLVHRDVSPPNVLLSYTGEVRADRLRAGGVDAEAGEDRARDHLRQGQLHVARAGARRDARRPHRPLRGGHHPVGAAHRAAAVPVEQAAGRAKDGHTSEEIAAARAQPRDRAAVAARASRVPPELDRIAMKALAPEPKDRYATCEELRDDLATFLAQTSPATDVDARRDLPARAATREDIAAERAEREALIVKAREWYSAKHVVRCRPRRDAASRPEAVGVGSGVRSCRQAPSLTRAAVRRGVVGTASERPRRRGERARRALGFADNARERELTVREPSSIRARDRSVRATRADPALTDSQTGSRPPCSAPSSTAATTCGG